MQAATPEALARITQEIELLEQRNILAKQNDNYIINMQFIEGQLLLQNKPADLQSLFAPAKPAAQNSIIRTIWCVKFTVNGELLITT